VKPPTPTLKEFANTFGVEYFRGNKSPRVASTLG
jgi:hypothetical protein